jgi:hypothetical protein
MKTSKFGEPLRAHREGQRITLESIAEQTKIKITLLEALERDDLSRWPEGIFRRAYVRSYAKAIGLDPETVLRQFLEVYPEPVEEVPTEDVSATGLRYLLSRFRSAETPAPRRPRDTTSESSGEAPPLQPSADEPPAIVLQTGAEAQLAAVAALCTRLGRAAERAEIASALQESLKILNAVGVIVWLWVSGRQELVSVLAQGYSDRIVAQLPAVSADADNAIGTAFRSAQAQVVPGKGDATGAVVAPLLTPHGCAGVLAIELATGSERCETTRGFAMILAAQLATVISVSADDSQVVLSGAGSI